MKIRPLDRGNSKVKGLPWAEGKGVVGVAGLRGNLCLAEFRRYQLYYSIDGTEAKVDCKRKAGILSAILRGSRRVMLGTFSDLDSAHSED